VEIRAGGDEQAELAREGAVARLGRGVVIRVRRLDRVEAGGGERGDQMIARADAGMRERRDAAGAVDDRDDLLGRAPQRGT
jgi:hypothetical protein